MAVEESLRPEMVQIAEHFLRSNIVKDRSPESVRSFLSSKGLSPSEIEKAFSKPLEFTQTVAPITVGVQQGGRTVGARVLAFLSKFRDFCSFAFFAVAAFYGLHFLYEHYLRPWLTGRPPPPPPGRQVAQLQEAVAESLSQLHAAVDTLRRSVTSCTAALQSPQTDSVQALAESVNEMKKDVASLRSMLLKKTNFTATPPVARSIPEWQKNGISALASSAGAIPASPAGRPTSPVGTPPTSTSLSSPDDAVFMKLTASSASNSTYFSSVLSPTFDASMRKPTEESAPDATSQLHPPVDSAVSLSSSQDSVAAVTGTT